MILGTCSGLLYVALFSPKQTVMLSINWIIDVIRCRWTNKPFTHLQEGLFYNVALSVVIFICLGRPQSGRSRIFKENIKHTVSHQNGWVGISHQNGWVGISRQNGWVGWAWMGQTMCIYIYLIYIIHHPNLLTDSYIFISMSLTLDVTWKFQWKYIFNQNQKHKLFPSISPCTKQGFSTFSPWSTPPLIRDPGSSWRGMCSNTSRHNTTLSTSDS